jgi:hypothetical protein
LLQTRAGPEITVGTGGSTTVIVPEAVVVPQPPVSVTV